MKKWLLSGLLFLTINAYAGVEDLTIPRDINILPYSAIIGLDKNGDWQAFSLKEISPGVYSFDFGTLTAKIEGSISTVLQIDQPIWEAQPKNFFINTLSIALQPYGTYAYQVPGGGVIPTGYSPYIEYITFSKNDTPLDYMNFNLYVNLYGEADATYLALCGEISPASPQTIFKPPIAIPLKSVTGTILYKIIFQNKCNYIQNMNVGIVITYRKQTL